MEEIIHIGKQPISSHFYRKKKYNLKKYSLDLYKELEKTTGLSTGLKQNGAITVASSKERLQELSRQATTAQLFGVEAEVLDKKKT